MRCVTVKPGQQPRPTPAGPRRNPAALAEQDILRQPPALMAGRRVTVQAKQLHQPFLTAPFRADMKKAQPRLHHRRNCPIPDALIPELRFPLSRSDLAAAAAIGNSRPGKWTDLFVNGGLAAVYVYFDRFSYFPCRFIRG